jgi:hypothetical protein
MKPLSRIDMFIKIFYFLMKEKKKETQSINQYNLKFKIFYYKNNFKKYNSKIR